MPAVAVIGAQWGDEGKGKIVDLLAETAQFVVRFAGGNNAGHTVINPLGEFKMHLLPSGVFHPGVTCIIGNGVVVDPAVLLHEIDILKEQNIDTCSLLISDRANMIMPLLFIKCNRFLRKRCLKFPGALWTSKFTGGLSIVVLHRIYNPI